MKLPLSIFFGALAAATFLGGCTPPPLTVRDLPEGEQTVSGMVEPVELSLVRRGTHVLSIEGEPQYYLESSTVHLRTYEGKRVTLRGILEQNVDPRDLPVMVLESVVEVEETTKIWEFPTLGVRVTTPSRWTSMLEGRSIHFSDLPESPSIVVLSEADGNILPGGTSMVVDGYQASIIMDEQIGSQTVSILRDGKVLTLRFLPHAGSDLTEARTEWLDLLHSLSLHVRSASVSSRRKGTGSTLMPCGGSAGILCPEGMYCAVTDVRESIGACRFL